MKFNEELGFEVPEGDLKIFDFGGEVKWMLKK